MDENADVIATQKILNEKIDKASGNINSILTLLGNIPPNAINSQASDAVNILVDTVSPSPNSSSNTTTTTNSQSNIFEMSNEEIILICNQVTELFNDLASFRVELNSTNEAISRMKEKHEKDIKDMEEKYNNEIAKMKKKYDEELVLLKEKSNDLDQHPRLNNLIFRNFYIPDGDWSGYTFACYIATTLNNLLPMLEMPVTPYNIDIAHPLRKTSRGENVVIVRFTNRHVRHDIYKNKDYLLNYDIYVTEQLTKDNLKLLFKAKSIVGGPNAWSYNGKIFAFSQNKRYLVKNEESLKFLVSTSYNNHLHSNTTFLSNDPYVPSNHSRASPRRGEGHRRNYYSSPVYNS